MKVLQCRKNFPLTNSNNSEISFLAALKVKYLRVELGAMITVNICQHENCGHHVVGWWGEVQTSEAPEQAEPHKSRTRTGAIVNCICLVRPVLHIPHAHRRLDVAAFGNVSGDNMRCAR